MHEAEFEAITAIAVAGPLHRIYCVHLSPNCDLRVWDNYTASRSPRHLDGL